MGSALQFLSVADRQLHSASPSQLLDTSVIALQASPRATVHADRVSKMGQVTCVQIVDALYANCTTPNLKICKHHRWWCWLGQIGMHSADRLVVGGGSQFLGAATSSSCHPVLPPFSPHLVLLYTEELICLACSWVKML